MSTDKINDGSSGYECVRCLECVTKEDLSDVSNEGGYVCKSCAADVRDEDLLRVAKEIISTEAACIEWEAKASRSIQLVYEKLKFVRDTERALNASRLPAPSESCETEMPAEVERLRKELTVMTATAESFSKQVDRHAEEEGAICPEDIGCIEFIGILKKQIADLSNPTALLDKITRAQDTLADAARLLTEAGAKPVGFSLPDGTEIPLDAAERLYARHMAELAELKQKIEDHKNGDIIDREEFEDICATEQIPYGSCCKTHYCSLAPFHYIGELRKQIEELKATLPAPPDAQKEAV